MDVNAFGKTPRTTRPYGRVFCACDFSREGLIPRTDFNASLPQSRALLEKEMRQAFVRRGGGANTTHALKLDNSPPFLSGKERGLITACIEAELPSSDAMHTAPRALS